MGKRGLGVWVFVLTLICLAGAALSAGTCMRFLKIATLPRIGGMGDATVAVRDATWAETNPAHLTEVDGSLITFLRHAEAGLSIDMVILSNPELVRTLVEGEDFFVAPVAWVDRHEFLYTAGGHIRRRLFNAWS